MIYNMEQEIKELLVKTARIEENTRQIIKSNDDQEIRIRSLEKKWWSSLGALGIAIAALIKTFYTNS